MTFIAPLRQPAHGFHRRRQIRCALAIGQMGRDAKEVQPRAITAAAMAEKGRGAPERGHEKAGPSGMGRPVVRRERVAD